MEASAAAPVLEARRLTKRYRRDRPAALVDIDLGVPAGAFVALVGPNGAGKSTLIRCWMGFERPTRGHALVMGIDPQRERTAALSSIGYVGQAPGLYEGLTVADHLALALTLRRTFDRAGATRRLDDLGIPGSVRASQLSGGQQAQLALALALGTRGRVLLLDEPLARLDPLARRDFLAIVSDAVRREGTTALLASHIVGDLDGVCDRLVVLAPARVMLDTGIDWARRHHRVVPLADASEMSAADVVGSFGDQRGARHALVRSAEPVDNPASLDDVVLGYLAAARPVGTGQAR
jgi:ABC-2 type transport system ATP-binding protein